MASEATWGEKFLSALLESKNVSGLYQLGPIRQLLLGHEATAWDFVETHLNTHGVLPSKPTLLAHQKELFLPEAEEPPSYYHEHLMNRFITKRLKESVAAAQEHLSPADPNPNAAYEAMMGVLLEVAEVRSGTNMVEAGDMGSIVYDEIQYIKGTKLAGELNLGWPYFDEMNGGLRRGDLISLCARPERGKTFVLLYASRFNWVNQNATPLFVTMEMDPVQILMRLVSLETHIETRKIRTAHLSTEQEKTIHALEDIKGKRKPFYVVDGNLAATVQEVQLLARQLRPSIVYVDGAYLLRHPDPKLGFYTRVGVVCEELKRMASSLGIPVVCSWQFNREADKKQKSTTKGSVGLEDIAFADSIGQLSSVVFGMFELDSVETQIRRKITILKGRGGEQGEFEINWDFNKMDFSQIPVPKMLQHDDEKPDAGEDAIEGIVPSSAASFFKKTGSGMGV